MGKVRVFTEDSYGVGFIRALVKKFKKEGKIPHSFKIKPKPIPGLCSKKFERAIKASCLDYDKVVIFIDGDGEEDIAKYNQQEHTEQAPENCKTSIVVNEYEIEEWILYARDEKVKGNPKPSKAIKTIIPKYKKHSLTKSFGNTIKNPKCWDKVKKYRKFKELHKAILCRD